jgi:glycerol kinase
MQFQSDILKENVERSAIEEISALGAAFMAGLAFGFWKDLDELKTLRKSDKIFQPQMEPKEVDALYAGWKKAVEKSKIR